MKKLYFYTIFLLSVVASFTIVHLTVKNNKHLGLEKLFQTTQLRTLDERINLFVVTGFYLGIYVFALVVLVILFRVTRGKSPLDNADPPLIKCLNQLLTHTLQQSLIFGSFYAYWLHYVARNTRIEEALLFPFLFLLSRVIFTVLYLLSTLLKVPPLRSSGFIINLIVLGTLLVENITPVPILTRYYG